MQINQTNGADYIWDATSDCGRVRYLPIGNDRIIINGRDAWRGDYRGADGRATGGTVEADLWQIARELMDAVDIHNRANLDAARDAATARDGARYESLSKAMTGTRGTYTDENTF